MINAELNHNPYIPQTIVKFNGKPPRINSQIEKFDKQPLKDWVHRVPEIFYNEMNGYDFELLFSGRDSDYDEICRAFSVAGVSEEMVRVIHIHELEDTETKSNRIDALLNWLRNHPNRRFSFADFWNENHELFESTYPYIIIGGEAPGYLNPSIGVELVDSMCELASTVLTSTPLLFVIDKQNYSQFREDLVVVKSRTDIRPEQLFFMIRDSLNADKIGRFISDMGIKNPQIVDQADDNRAIKYLRNYPVTEYIIDAIGLFRTTYNTIHAVLDKENEAMRKANVEIYAVINRLDTELSALKQIDEFFSASLAFLPPREIYEYRSNLKVSLSKWKNRKTKASGEEEAQSAATDFMTYIVNILGEYVTEVSEKTQKSKASIEAELKEKFLLAQVDTDFVPSGVPFSLELTYILPEIPKTLIELQTVTYVEAKGDIFDVFRRPNSEQNREPVRVVTWYFDQWRSKVLEIIEPIAVELADKCAKVLAEYQKRLICAYHDHVQQLIHERRQSKATAESQLSSDELILQKDNDWLSAFNDRLTQIERG